MAQNDCGFDALALPKFTLKHIEVQKALCISGTLLKQERGNRSPSETGKSTFSRGAPPEADPRPES